jgi:4-diphosphocytidyl-2-C-methyl-D-erythritol kinase
LAAVVERAARAKINLALHVLRRRADGFHDIDTLAVFADFADRLLVSAASDLTFSATGPFAGHVPAGRENLAYRAADLLRQRAGHAGGAAIRLEKNIPAGAGFGGGSADAAATLHALAALWQIGPNAADLPSLAAELGADVPMCLASASLRARGVGEIVEPLAGWPPLPLVLVWPAVTLSTDAVFAALDARTNPGLPALPGDLTPTAIAAWLRSCRNDLEAPARRLAPEIAAAVRRLADMPGALIARMSGSGSGCFALFESAAAAEAAAVAMARLAPGWWVKATVAG